LIWNENKNKIKLFIRFARRQAGKLVPTGDKRHETGTKTEGENGNRRGKSRRGCSSSGKAEKFSSIGDALQMMPKFRTQSELPSNNCIELPISQHNNSVLSAGQSATPTQQTNILPCANHPLKSIQCNAWHHLRTGSRATHTNIFSLQLSSF